MYLSQKHPSITVSSTKKRKIESVMLKKKKKSEAIYFFFKKRLAIYIYCFTLTAPYFNYKSSISCCNLKGFHASLCLCNWFI